MKKRIVLILCIVLGIFFMTGCDESVQKAPEKAPDIVITVDEFGEGTVVEEIPVYVTFDGEPVECTTEWFIYFEEDYDYLNDKDRIPSNYWGRVDVYYVLPKDVTVDDITVTIEAVNGTYDGTGDVGVDSEGRVKAWSHIQYDFRSKESVEETETIVEETESKASEKKPEEPRPETQKPETPKSEPETKPHVHNWAVDKNHSLAASCETAGWKQFYCTGCSETYREELAAYGHNWNTRIVKEATCTENGERQYDCSNCGWSYDESIPATGHSLSSSTVSAPSCTDQGRGVNRCSICGYEESYSIGAAGHSWGAYYYSSGLYHARTCSICGVTEEASHSFASSSDVRCLGCGADIVN